VPASITAAPGFVTVPAPPLLPPRISLLTSADIINETTPRWEGGHAYLPETCDLAGIDTICPPPDQYGVAASTPAQVEVSPFFIYAIDRSSTFNRLTRDFYGRAQRNLIASEAYLLERELMENSLGISGNLSILDPAVTKTTVTTGPTEPHMALSMLEQAASQILGERILIHIRPRLLAHLVNENVCRREGNVWFTPMDSIIVPGRGYSGVGPNGEPVSEGSEWMYATGRVEIRRGPIVFLPEQLPATAENPFGIPQSAVNRQTNDIAIAAQRIVSVSFNPQCGVFAAEVNNACNDCPQIR